MTISPINFLFQPRPRWQLALLAVGLASAYMAMTFDWSFVTGSSAFWQNPYGPWLLDPDDRINSVDILGQLAGYSKYAQSDWQFPLLLIPGLGPAGGTSGIFLDLIPIAAVPGKVLTGLTGSLVNPYGVWTIVAFILSALFAALIMAETSAAHYLGAFLAAFFAISAPPLLHRFGHFVMFGQFTILAAIWLGLIDRRLASWRRVATCWAVLLCTALTVGVYIFVITGTIYVASWLDRRGLRLAHRMERYGEPLAIAAPVAALMIIGGHFGGGTTSPFGAGFGQFSMNLASPFWPQRSGLLPGFWSIIDATGGQYEGFNYFGAGGLLLIAVAVIRHRPRLREAIRRHRGYFVVGVGLTLFALSDQIFFFNLKILDIRVFPSFDYVLGTFRSSGRFFWPVYYAALMTGIVLSLAGLPRRQAMALGIIACALQAIDTEPLRSRLTILSRRDLPMQLDALLWQKRIHAARDVFIAPSYGCGRPDAALANAELGLLAGRANRPANTVHNPRGATDCRGEQEMAARGPFQDTTLYVFLEHFPNSLPDGHMPATLQCGVFTGGTWCFGKKAEP